MLGLRQPHDRAALGRTLALRLGVLVALGAREALPLRLGRRLRGRGVLGCVLCALGGIVRRSTKFHAHDEQNAAKIGDLVRIVETRPLSKTKNWRLAEVLEAAK